MIVVLNRLELLPTDLQLYISEYNKLDKILDLFNEWFKIWFNNIYNSHSIIDISMMYPNIYLMVNINEMIMFTDTYQKFKNNKDISKILDDFAVYIIKQKRLKCISKEYIRNYFYENIKKLYV